MQYQLRWFDESLSPVQVQALREYFANGKKQYLAVMERLADALVDLIGSGIGFEFTNWTVERYDRSMRLVEDLSMRMENLTGVKPFGIGRHAANTEVNSSEGTSGT